MTSIVLLILLLFLACEILIRMPLSAKAAQLVGLFTKLKKVLLSDKISDYSKERLVPAYALRACGLSIVIFALIVGSFLPLVVGGIFIYGSAAQLLQAFADPILSFTMLVLSIIYFWIRRKMGA